MAITGTAVFKIALSRGSIRKTNATSLGSSRFAERCGKFLFVPAAGNRIPWGSIEPL